MTPAREFGLVLDKAICFYATLFLLLTVGCATARKPRDPHDPEAQAFRRLRGDSAKPPEIRVRSGVPATVLVDVPIPAGLPDDPVIHALDYLDRYKGLYQLTDPRQQLFLHRIKLGSARHLFFGQKHNDIPVFAGELAVHMMGGRVVLTNGHYLRTIPPLPGPALDAAQATALAVAGTAGTEMAAIGAPRLMYFDQSLLTGGEPDTHLAWRVTVRGLHQDKGGGTWTVFVDAHDGTLLFSIDQSPTAKEFLVETVHESSYTWTGCWEGPDEVVDEEWFNQLGPTGYPGLSEDAFGDGPSAFNLTHQVYDYFFDNFKRDGWDNDSEWIWIELQVGTDNYKGFGQYDGAGCIKFKTGGIAADGMGHEWSHAIDDNEGDLEYVSQSGALDESFADFFGSMVDGDWPFGEDTPSAPAAFRDLSNPPGHDTKVSACFDLVTGASLAMNADYDHPDHMTRYCVTTDDSGGVHINSGIPNKAAFLITDGGSHNGFLINGIGRKKAQRLYHDVLVYGVTSATDFVEARNILVNFAWTYATFPFCCQINPGDPCCHFTLTDVCNVKNAFASVGISVGSADRDCDGSQDDQDPDDDGDSWPDAVDNCVEVPNPIQADTDGLGLGDACDDDDDSDGQFDGEDNCPQISNADQKDGDSDGIGDACDDGDKDGFLDGEDNCPEIYNSFQENLDGSLGDLLGDACDVDDDGDGILDIHDSCPLTSNADQATVDGDAIGDACDNCPDKFNPLQTDCNGNGIGTVCDVSEGSDHEKPCDFPYNVAVDRYVAPGDLVSLPACAGCGDWLGPDDRIIVRISGPLMAAMAIVDEQGRLIKRGVPGREQTLSFRPKAAFSYRPPGSRDQHFQGTRYFLQIPGSAAAAGGFRIQLSVEAALAPAHETARVGTP
jgi:hypothetical protein